MNLRDLVKVMNDSDKIITGPYRKWLLEHGDDGYSAEVQSIMAREFAKVPRDRRFSFSASSAGQCLRAQLFSFLGTPGVRDFDPELINLFSDGKWRHLRWQANLLSAGILSEIEVASSWRKYKALGSMDGTGFVPNDHPNKKWRGLRYGFELKGVNPFIYANIVKEQEEQVAPAIKEEHKRQVHRYFLMNGDIQLFVIIYENKATQTWIEWVVEPDDEYLKTSRKELVDLNRAADGKQLPKRLPDCQQAKGDVFRNQCSFGTLDGPCSRTQDWPREKRMRVRKP